MTFRRLILAILICMLTVFWSCASIGTTPNRMYFEAESCYNNLKKNPEHQKYRSYWMDCISKFKAVHSQDPHGPWAAAGLFMAGKLYREKYEHSYAPSDLEKARSLFRRIIENYPASAYKKDARQALERMGTAGADSGEARKMYFEAESCYQDLKNHPERQKYRSSWIKCIQRFREVHAHDPDGPWAAAGLFMTAELYEGLYAHSYNSTDKKKARSLFRRIIDEYPSSA